MTPEARWASGERRRGRREMSERQFAGQNGQMQSCAGGVAFGQGAV
jgi:hypothetical protein